MVPGVIALALFLTCRVDKFPLKPTHTYEWPTGTPESQQLNAGVIDGAMERAHELGFVSSLLLVRGGILVAETYYQGFLEDACPIHSTTKSLVSSLIGLAMAHGFIDSLEQRVLDFFREFDTANMDTRVRNITLRHLLMMTSGFPSDDVVGDYFDASYESTMEAILHMQLLSEPGETFRYCTLAVHLLSGVIYKASGLYTKDFADRYLCQPLEIDLYTWPLDEHGHHFGGTGIWITPRDLARFGQLYMNMGTIDGQQILPSDWIEASVTDAVGSLGSWGELKNLGYGYLWWTGTIRDQIVYMAIGYAGQNIFAFPELDLMVVTTTINPASDSEAGRQIVQLFELIADHVLPAVEDGGE